MNSGELDPDNCEMRKAENAAVVIGSPRWLGLFQMFQLRYERRASGPPGSGDDRGAVAQDFRQAGHDFGRVVVHADDGIRAQLLSVVAH